MTRWVMRAIVLVSVLTVVATAQQMERELPQPISTAEIERSITKAMIAPPSPGNANAPPLAQDALDPELRARIAAIEPMHDAYLAKVLALRDRVLVEQIAAEPKLRDGANLSAAERHERQMMTLRARAIEAEEQLLLVIAEAMPEAQRPRVEAMRRERARRRHGERMADHAGVIALDVIELVEMASLPPEQRAALEPLLADYEQSLVIAARRYQVMTERGRARLLTALRAREGEFVAAVRANPPNHALARAIRLEASAQSMQGIPLVAVVTALRELNRRTILRVLAELPVESRRTLMRTARSGFLLDERGPLVDGADFVSRRLRDGGMISEGERTAVAALRAQWLESDLALAIDRMQLAERMLDLENPWPDPQFDESSLAAAREERRAIDEQRTKRARALLAAIVNIIGMERAAKLGVFIPRGAALANGVEWSEPESQDAAIADEAANGAETAEAKAVSVKRLAQVAADRRAVAPVPTDRGALQSWVERWTADSALRTAIMNEHRAYEEAWKRKVEPALQETVAAVERVRTTLQGPDTDELDFSVATAIVDQAAAAQQRALDAAWSTETALFDAIERVMVRNDLLPELVALRMTRLWQMGGGVGDRPGLLSEWGQPVEVSVADWALDTNLPEAARRVLLQKIVAERTSFEAMLRERAATTLDAALQQYRRNLILRVRVDDERYEGWSTQLAQDDTIVSDASAAAIENAVSFTREVLENAALALDGDARDDFRASVYAAMFPGLCADNDSAAALLEQLLRDETLSEADRAVVQRIARVHRAGHSAAVAGMIAAANALAPVDEDLRSADRNDAWRRRMHEVARWRFERSEANAKARMHLRNELSRETLERIPSLSAEWIEPRR